MSLSLRRKLPAGGFRREVEDHGFMYGHAFEDLDGHTWEPFWMEQKALP